MIAIDDCQHGFLYKLNSRNLDYGVYCANTKSFVGIREKFDNKFLESDGYIGTCVRCSSSPVECLNVQFKGEVCEESKELFDFLEIWGRRSMGGQLACNQ